MKLLPIAFALALAGCATIPTSTPVPATIADRTVLDEKAGILAETAYTAASRTGATLVRAGVLDKAAFKAADAKGYAAILATRSAYDASNAADYATAIANTYAAVAQITAMTKGH